MACQRSGEFFSQTFVFRPTFAHIVQTLQQLRKNLKKIYNDNQIELYAGTVTRPGSAHNSGVYSTSVPKGPLVRLQ
jgi:hypothetical protein